MAAIAQTISIVDKSGKVVSTSKQLKNVFKEARSAYLERKAEIVTERKAREDRELRKAIKAMSVADDERSERSQSRPHKHRTHSGRDRDVQVRPPTGERHYSGGSVRSGYSSTSPTTATSRHSPVRSPLARHASVDDASEADHDFYATTRSSPPSPMGGGHELIRRRTDLELMAPQTPPRPGSLSRANTTSAVDMDADLDLAYGEFHPDLVSPAPMVVTRSNDQQELSSLVLKCKMLIDEANCAQHSVKAIMAHLQKNPDAMAAVALTLAEISNVASKMAPGVLTALKAGAPTVFALLAAPEFLIAVGVSVGITIVMFGGYKIIKKIKARAAADKEGAMDEMINVDELDRIESWRRGIADDQLETASVATSVEGEFITPAAARSMGHLPMPQGGEAPVERKKKRRSSKKDRDVTSEKSSRAGSTSSEKSARKERERALVKVKKPSPLRRMFNSSGKTEKGTSIAS